VSTARIGDPADHRRALGPVGARRIDARVAQVAGAGSPWRSLSTLGADADASLDVVVTVGAFCAARDLEPAVATARRVLAPGGRLHFLEHVGRPGAMGMLQRMADPMWASLPSGCHVDHDVVAALRSCGFVVLDLERCTVPSVVPFLRHWVQGTAMVSD
jgi:SAM-dependent methyltransferase